MANKMITTELTHSNGTSCVFTFTNMDGFISADVKATRAPRTLNVRLNGKDMIHVLDRMEEDVMCGDSYIDEAVADLAFEMRHLLAFAQSV